MTLIYTLTWTLDGLDDHKDYRDYNTALRASKWLEDMNATNIKMDARINTPEFNQEEIDNA